MKTKLQLPKFFTSKRKKLRATAARRPLRIAAATSYDEIVEPNMKLSRALLIVLLLHVVAVAGIIAFNAIKTHQPSISAARATNPVIENAKPATKSIEADASSPGSATKQPPEAQATRSTTKAKDLKLPASSGKTYVVAKGDNPVAIAKKFKVSYDDLLALNHIDDPRKLQIGQKLLIPNKPAKGKRNE